MKRSLSIISALCLFAPIFVSCQVEKPIENIGEHRVTIVSGGLDTKTAVSEGTSSASYVWTGTTAEMVHVWENGNGGTNVSIALSDSDKKAAFSADFSGTSAPFSYYALIASTVSTAKNPLLKNEQNPTLSSFDPAADILVGKTTEQVDDAPSTISMSFGRAVTANKMTLTNFKGENEVVKKVVFNAANTIAGRISVNFDNCSVREYGIGSENKKSISLNYGDGASIPSEGFPVYFLAFPTSTGDFSVEVTTDQYVYTKNVTGKSLEFKLGTFTRFSFSLEDAEATSLSSLDEYFLVESVDDLAEGDIVCFGTVANQKVSGSTHVYAKDGSLTAIGASDATIVDGTLTSSDVFAFTLGKDNGGWTFETPDGKLLGTTAAKDMEFDDGTTTWTIAIDNSGDATINSTDSGKGKIQYNVTNPRFLNYTSNQGAIQIYKLDDGKQPLGEFIVDITPNGIEKSILVEWIDLDHAINYTISCTGKDDVSVASGVGEYTFANLEPGQYTITVIANPEDGYKNAKYTETVEVENLTPSVEVQESLNLASTAASGVINVTASHVTLDVEVFEDESCSSPLTGEDAWLTASINDGNIAYSVAENSVAESRVAYIQLYALGDDGETEFTKVITVTQNAAATSGIQEISIADFLLETPGTEQLYQLTGKVSAITNSTYGNFTLVDLSDANISVSVRGLCATEVTDGVNDKSFSSLDLKEGDHVTIVSKCTVYNDVIQAGGQSSPAYHVSHESPASISASNVTGVSKDGCSNQKFTVTFGNAEGWTPSISSDGTIVTSATLSGNEVTYSVASNSGSSRTGSITLTLKKDGWDDVKKDISVSQDGTATTKSLVCDFESATTTNWNIASFARQTSSGGTSPHAGDYFANTGSKTTGYAATSKVVASPQSITFYVSKESTNTTSSSWLVQTSADGVNWTTVSTNSATSMTKNVWVGYTVDLTDYSNVYVRVYYSGTTAIRDIDDITLTYQE